MFKFIHSFRTSLFLELFFLPIFIVLPGIYKPNTDFLSKFDDIFSYLADESQLLSEETLLQPKEISYKAALPFSPIMKIS